MLHRLKTMAFSYDLNFSTGAESQEVALFSQNEIPWERERLARLKGLIEGLFRPLVVFNRFAASA